MLGGGSACNAWPPSLWTEFLTHACENITFPQLLLRAVTSNICFIIKVHLHWPNANVKATSLSNGFDVLFILSGREISKEIFALVQCKCTQNMDISPFFSTSVKIKSIPSNFSNVLFSVQFSYRLISKQTQLMGAIDVHWFSIEVNWSL